jgi:hypothetical protein
LLWELRASSKEELSTGTGSLSEPLTMEQMVRDTSPAPKLKYGKRTPQNETSEKEKMCDPSAML